jgi:predicted phage tail protein
MNRLVEVHLHGPLGDMYGNVHRLSVMTPREAVHAMNTNYPGFLADFMEHERYGVFVDGDWRTGDDAAILPASRDIHFYPVIEGNTPLLAPALISLGMSVMAANIVSSLIILGLSVGLSFLFRPKPPEQAKGEERDESFIFSGPENVTGQGVAVPVIYGRVYAGTVVVSAGQDTVDIKTTTNAKAANKPASGNSSNDGTPDPVWVDHTLYARRAIGPTIIDPFEPWPDLNTIGSGVDHLLPPPVEGYPAIIADPVYGFKPDGWIPSKVIWVVDDDDDARKQVMVWQPDYETVDYVYNWNMVRGFYSTPVGIEAEEDEWIDGADMEELIEEPSP